MSIEPTTVSRPTLRRATPALLLLVLMVQACGGGGDDDSGSTSATSPSAPAPASTLAPLPSTAPSPPAAAGADITCGLANFQADALRLVNAYRAAGATCGSRGSFAPAGALAWNAQLTNAAFGHSSDMASRNYFSHMSADGRSMVDRVEATGYNWSTLGENIGGGQRSVEEVVAGWMGSEGHCANLMNPRFTEMGMACARNESSAYTLYWTQNLGQP
jgi:uncharacterized protein YkwD